VVNEVDKIYQNLSIPKRLGRMSVAGYEDNAYTHPLAFLNAARNLAHMNLTAQLLPYLQLGRVGAVQAFEHN
jgi:hypothetical protein